MNLLGRKRLALSVVAQSRAVRPDRERLKESIAALAARRAAIAEERATLGRYQEIMQTSEDLAREARQAETEEKEFRKVWARSGCKYSDTTELERLSKVSAEKAQAAKIARVNAEAVTKEHQQVEERVRSMQLSIVDHERDIDAAIHAIIVEEAKELFERLESLAEEYRAARAEANYIAEIVTMRPPYHSAGGKNQSVVDGVLFRGHIHTWDRELSGIEAGDSVHGTRVEQDRREALQKPWIDRAAQLRANPDA